MKEKLTNKLFFKISLFSLYTAFTLEAGMSNAETVSKLEDWRFDPEALQLEIILSAPSQPRYFFLSQPSRIVVDLPSTKLGYVSTQQNFYGAIKSIRVSQLNADVTRIVMDLMPGTFINPNQVQLQPVSPENPTRWVLSPVTVSNNAYSIPTNIFPSYQQTPNSGLYNPPPPSQNQPFPTTTYYNQQPLVTVPPLLPNNPSQLPNSTLPPAIFPNQSGNLNSIPFFPTPDLPNYPLPNSSNNQITNPNPGAIEFGKPLPNNTR
ncbi:AMIN domain-containing protein [Fischerella thermalis]|uniref:AMIN domain-containing protein n=1 Tax=Fischerella thermalis TaxID=372787 RepID=UPI000C7F96BE|nr:AMIN domain-containing protein [Fischerella thermalis]PLZ13218.1 AMIN domain-containing protein [Fischerella thermalis WC114]PLZ21595.1 AMIN domain-containing protein [Fischerella thermalis WC157]PLZ33888.1 AMIN domain-containing protein [Fischerella thermalis WC558]PLZ58346.1 AMIN domain-containing protein [Fischerella thermalis WC439]PLZ71045.1 AMIN domain-containing protein [Fischerella thermalis WC246]